MLCRLSLLLILISTILFGCTNVVPDVSFLSSFKQEQKVNPGFLKDSSKNICFKTMPELVVGDDAGFLIGNGAQENPLGYCRQNAVLEVAGNSFAWSGQSFTFGTEIGSATYIRRTYYHSDGSVFISGNFRRDQRTETKVLRIFKDGSVYEILSEPELYTLDIAGVYGDLIYVYGEFSKIKNRPRQKLAVLNYKTGALLENPSSMRAIENCAGVQILGDQIYFFGAGRYNCKVGDIQIRSSMVVKKGEWKLREDFPNFRYISDIVFNENSEEYIIAGYHVDDFEQNIYRVDKSFNLIKWSNPVKGNIYGIKLVDGKLFVRGYLKDAQGNKFEQAVINLTNNQIEHSGTDPVFNEYSFLSTKDFILAKVDGSKTHLKIGSLQAGHFVWKDLEIDYHTYNNNVWLEGDNIFYLSEVYSSGEYQYSIYSKSIDSGAVSKVFSWSGGSLTHRLVVDDQNYYISAGYIRIDSETRNIFAVVSRSSSEFVHANNIINSGAVYGVVLHNDLITMSGSGLVSHNGVSGRLIEWDQSTSTERALNLDYGIYERSYDYDYYYDHFSLRAGELVIPFNGEVFTTGNYEKEKVLRYSLKTFTKNLDSDIPLSYYWNDNTAIHAYNDKIYYLGENNRLVRINADNSKDVFPILQALPLNISTHLFMDGSLFLRGESQTNVSQSMIVDLETLGESISSGLPANQLYLKSHFKIHNDHYVVFDNFSPGEAYIFRKQGQDWVAADLNLISSELVYPIILNNKMIWIGAMVEPKASLNPGLHLYDKDTWKLIDTLSTAPGRYAASPINPKIIQRVSDAENRNEYYELELGPRSLTEVYVTDATSSWNNSVAKLDNDFYIAHSDALNGNVCLKRVLSDKSEIIFIDKGRCRIVGQTSNGFFFTTENVSIIAGQSITKNLHYYNKKTDTFDLDIFHLKWSSNNSLATDDFILLANGYYNSVLLLSKTDHTLVSVPELMNCSLDLIKSNIVYLRDCYNMGGFDDIDYRKINYTYFDLSSRQFVEQKRIESAGSLKVLKAGGQTYYFGNIRSVNGNEVHAHLFSDGGG